MRDVRLFDMAAGEIQRDDDEREVDEREARERRAHLQPAEIRRDRRRGFLQPHDDPGLTARLRDKPARGVCNEGQGQQEGQDFQPEREEAQAIRPGEEAREECREQHEAAGADHGAEGQNRPQTSGR